MGCWLVDLQIGRPWRAGSSVAPSVCCDTRSSAGATRSRNLLLVQLVLSPIYQWTMGLLPNCPRHWMTDRTLMRLGWYQGFCSGSGHSQVFRPWRSSTLGGAPASRVGRGTARVLFSEGLLMPLEHCGRLTHRLSCPILGCLLPKIDQGRRRVVSPSCTVLAPLCLPLCKGVLWPWLVCWRSQLQAFLIQYLTHRLGLSMQH